MGTRNVHADQSRQERYEERTLDNSFPSLKKYLVSGADILDVGCGPGTITVGVAGVVKPGTVTGVDIEDSLLRKARDLATRSAIGNVNFEKCDAHKLAFPDNTFDLSFTRNSLEWFLDPVDVVKEMVRVTKPGGLVVASDVDWGGIIYYPPCPAFDDFLSRAAEVQTDSNRNTHMDYQCGRKLYSYLRQAGLKDIQVEEAMHNIITSENGKAEELCEMVKGYLKQDPVADMILDESQKQSVVRDLNNWGNHPDAFCMQFMQLQVAGKVP